MARIKKGVNAKKKHKKVLKLAKGYYGAKSKLYRPANEAVMRALRSSYRGRKDYGLPVLMQVPVCMV